MIFMSTFPAGHPIGGPSAGITIATACIRQFAKSRWIHSLAMTEKSLFAARCCRWAAHRPKVEAARQAGLRRVLIPQQNWQDSFTHVQDLEVIPVDELQQVVELAVLEG